MSPDKKKILTKPLVVCLLAMVCCLLWGSAFPCIKIGYRLFAIAGTDRPTQILFAGCRFVLAGEPAGAAAVVEVRLTRPGNGGQPVRAAADELPKRIMPWPRKCWPIRRSAPNT